jgi:hypothetical protein
MLPQPRVETGGREILLDELLGPGFTALVRGAADLPGELTSHPLWQALAPTLHELGDSANLPPLAGYVAKDGAGVTLLRPDRFVLAQLPLDAGAARTLDRLQTMLAQPVSR